MKEIAELIEQLMKAHGDDLKRTAFVMLGDVYLAEDVTQETFISFYKNHHQFRAESTYKTYLYRIMMNHMKMHWRKRIPVPLENKENINEAIDFEDHLVDFMDLQEALFGLKKKYAEVITLHYYNQYSVDEISEILDLSTSNVKMRLKRGREHLKKILTGGIDI